jgi:cystathionine beta-lyase
MDLDDLDRQLASAELLILCHPHNPVARVWSRDELCRVAELAQRHEVMVVSDDIHCDIVLEGVYEPLVVAEPALAERTLTCCSPSKTFGLAGLNTAFTVVSDDRMRRRFTRELQRCGFHWGNIFGDAALIAAYSHGGPWLDALLEELRSNRSLVVDALGGLPGVRVLPVEGTYLAWIDLRGTGLGEEEILRRLMDEAKVGLEKGSDFGPEGLGYQRLNFATPRALLEPGLARIREVLGR